MSFLSFFFLNMWFCFWDASRSCKTHPGPVIHLSDCPTDPSKVKIITKWNYILKVKDSGCHVYSLENFPGLAFSPDRITQLITLCTYTSEWEKLWRDFNVNIQATGCRCLKFGFPPSASILAQFISIPYLTCFQLDFFPLRSLPKVMEGYFVPRLLHFVFWLKVPGLFVDFWG